MVSGAYAHLPQSSEQILHPEKYFAGERPVKINLPDLSNLLNPSNTRKQVTRSRRSRSQLPTAHRPLPTSSWRRIDIDVNGEWSYYLILDQFLKSAEESRRAAAGWAGDRYALYEQPQSGRILLEQVSVWDTAEDAREFFDAYVRRTALRYPTATLLTEPQHSTSDTLRRWQTNEGEVVIELRGSRVVILEGIPAGVESDEIVRSIRFLT